MYLELERMGFRVWYGEYRPPIVLSCSLSLSLSLSLSDSCTANPYNTDNRADDLTKDGMLKGIEQAAAFILFLR